MKTVKLLKQWKNFMTLAYVHSYVHCKINTAAKMWNLLSGWVFAYHMPGLIHSTGDGRGENHLLMSRWIRKLIYPDAGEG